MSNRTWLRPRVALPLWVLSESFHERVARVLLPVPLQGATYVLWSALTVRTCAFPPYGEPSGFNTSVDPVGSP